MREASTTILLAVQAQLAAVLLPDMNAHKFRRSINRSPQVLEQETTGSIGSTVHPEWITITGWGR